MTTATASRMVPRRRVVLCADFDQTLTVSDTTALLFQSAAMRQPTALAQKQHVARVQQLVAQYSREMSAFLAEKHGFNCMSNDASAQHNEATWLHYRRFDREGLRAFLAGYARVDMASLQRIMDAYVLEGIRSEDLEANAARIELMDGCVDVLALASRTGAAFVISSNWSIQMLHAALHGGPQESGNAISVNVIANGAFTKLARIFSRNALIFCCCICVYDDTELACCDDAPIDLEMSAEGAATGKIDLRVQSPQHKADWLQRIRTQERAAAAEQDADAPRVVFVGDSANDLLAMVEADVGISLAVGADASVYKVADRFGATFEPIGAETTATLADCAALVEDARSKGAQALFAANDWHEIRQLLARHRS